MWCIHIEELIQPTAWKKLRFILSDKFDFHMIDNLSIAVHAFTSGILILFSVDKMLLPSYVNLFIGLVCHLFD